MATAAGAFVVRVFSSNDYPLSLFGIYGVVSLLMTVSIRASYVILASSVQRSSHHGVPVLIYGAGRRGAAAARELFQNQGLNLRPVGFIDDDWQMRGKIVAGLPVLGTGRDMEHALRDTAASGVVISSHRITKERLERAAEACRERHGNLFHLHLGIRRADEEEAGGVTPAAGTRPDATAASGRRTVCRPGRRGRARLAAVPVVQGLARAPLESPQSLRALQEEPDRPPLVSLRGMRVARVAHPAGVRGADADRRSIPARSSFPHTAVSATAALDPRASPVVPASRRTDGTRPRAARRRHRLGRLRVRCGLSVGVLAPGHRGSSGGARGAGDAGSDRLADAGPDGSDARARDLPCRRCRTARSVACGDHPRHFARDAINRRAAGPHRAARSRVRAAADDRSGTDASRPGGCRVAGGVDRRRSAALLDRRRSRDGIGHRRARRAARAHGHRSAAAVHRENLRLLDAVTGRQSVRSLRQQESFRRLDADGDSRGDRAALQRRLAWPAWCSAGVAGESPVVVVARRQPAAAPDGGGRRHDAVALPDHVALGHGRGRARRRLRRTRLTPG